MADFLDYAWLIGDGAAALLERLAADVRPALQQLNSLRKELSPVRAQLLVEQTELRQRATAKFGVLAARMFFTPVQLEQATDLTVARYKASRFRAAVGAATMGDYCCGIGGDLLALAENGAAIGYDLSPVACLLAEANLRVARPGDASPSDRVHVEVKDVERLTPPADGAWHLDPDRRATGKRSTTLAEYVPGPGLIEPWRVANPQGAVKLAPATETPSHWAAEAELEWITSHRECRQLVAWFDKLATAPGQHRATLLKGSDDEDRAPLASSFVGTPGQSCEPDDEPRQFLFDPDPSVLAADLLGALAATHELKTLGAGGAYLTGETAVNDALLATFAVRDCLPLRPATIAQSLTARGVGQVEIKKRGVAIDPQSLRQKLKLRGDRSATVVLTRIGERQVAIIAERLPPSETPQG